MSNWVTDFKLDRHIAQGNLKVLTILPLNISYVTQSNITNKKIN